MQLLVSISEMCTQTFLFLHRLVSRVFDRSIRSLFNTVAEVSRDNYRRPTTYETVTFRTGGTSRN